MNFFTDIHQSLPYQKKPYAWEYIFEDVRWIVYESYISAFDGYCDEINSFDTEEGAKIFCEKMANH